jgi:hypothetical protein
MGYRDMIVVVEIAGSNIMWTEPRDLEFDKMSFQINDPDEPSISSNHRGGANVVIRHSAGGEFVLESTSPQLIKSLLTAPSADQELDAPLWLLRD